MPDFMSVFRCSRVGPAAMHPRGRPRPGPGARRFRCASRSWTVTCGRTVQSVLRTGPFRLGARAFRLHRHCSGQAPTGNIRLRQCPETEMRCSLGDRKSSTKPWQTATCKTRRPVMSASGFARVGHRQPEWGLAVSVLDLKVLIGAVHPSGPRTNVDLPRQAHCPSTRAAAWGPAIRVASLPAG